MRSSPYLKLSALLITGALCLFVIFSTKHSGPTPDDELSALVGELTYLNRSQKPNSNISYAITQPPPCERNELAHDVSEFDTLPAHIQDFLFYSHCRYFPMLLDAPDKCGGAQSSSDVFLLLVIKSSPANYDRREVLRKTWAEERLQNGMSIRRIFISGTSSSGWEKLKLNKLLEVESRKNKDILQWDFTDTFFNLTLKQTLFLEWMNRNCPNARFLLNGDDDVFANTDNMVEYLQSLGGNNGSRHLYVGNIVWYVRPIRDKSNKYYLPVQVYRSERFPQYCSGGGFLLSGFTARVIYNMSQSIPLIPIDDVYMGMCLEKAGLGPTAHFGVRATGMYIPSRNIDQNDPCYYREILLVHRFSSHQIYRMWDEIHDPNLKCKF